MDAVEHIVINKELLAIIVYSRFNQAGISFFTEDSLSQQVAFMKHPKGKVIQAHIHRPVAREVHYTQEVLLVRKGLLRVDFFTEDQVYQESRRLGEGDLILLIKGGHGFEALEDLEMFEVKQGPYAGELDKVRFVSTISEEQVRYE